MSVYRDPMERFFSKIEKDPSGCWLWTDTPNHKGYALLSVNRKMTIAHRWGYEQFVGPIPSGMQLDHTCYVRKCVNPDHLRLVTPKQNAENRVHVGSASGYRGVYPRKGGYVGSVGHLNKSYYVGFFRTAEEANAAVVAKRLELHTHNDLDRISGDD